MNPFLPASLSAQSLHQPKNQNSPYMKLFIPPNSQFDARRVAYLTPTKPTFNIGTTVQSDSNRRDFQKRSSDFKLPFIVDSTKRTRTIQSPPSNGQKSSQFFTYSDSPLLPRKTSPDRPSDIPFGLATMDKKVFVPEGMLPGFNGSDQYYNLGRAPGSKGTQRLSTNPAFDTLDAFINRDGLASPKKTENDSEDDKDGKQTTKRSRKKKSPKAKSPKEKKRKSKRAVTLDESQHHVRVNKNMLETVIQTALLGTRLNEQRLEKLEREVHQKYGPPSHDDRLRSPPNPHPRKYEYDSYANEIRANPNLLLHNRERDLFTPQQQPSNGGLSPFFDRNRPRYETNYKPSSRLEARLRGFKVNSYETSVNAEPRSGKHLTFADEYPGYHRNSDGLGPRNHLGMPIKTEAIDEESRTELYDQYQGDMYYNRRQFYQNPQHNDRSYDAQNTQNDDYYKNPYYEESKGSKRPLNSLLQDYFARGRDRDREFPTITDQPAIHSHFNDDGNYPQSLEIGKTIHDSFLKDKEDEEDEEEKNAQIKKSVLKQNRRFGVDEAEIARRKKELRIVLWGIAYTRLLSNSVRDYFRKKNKTFQDWFPRTSFNNAGMFQTFLAKHLPTPFMNILKEKKNLQIAGAQGTVKELDQKCKLISEHINNIFTQLLKNLKKEWLPSSFFVFLGSFVQDRSHLPHDYYTDFELDRVHISRYSALENMSPENIKMLIGGYAIVRVMLCRVMTKPWLTWNQTKHDDYDLMNSFNIASIIYHAFMDVFFNQNPIIPDNQRHLLKQEKVPSVRARTKAMDSGKYQGTDEDEYEGIIIGFYNKEALRSFIKDRPALYAKVIAWANTILDCLFEITKKHFNASSVDTKKYYTKLLPN